MFAWTRFHYIQALKKEIGYLQATLKGHYHDGKDDEPEAGMNTSPDVW
jgi:hypothetical protein